MNLSALCNNSHRPLQVEVEDLTFCTFLKLRYPISHEIWCFRSST